VACSAGKTSGKNTAGNNDVDLKVKNGMYVLPRDESSDSKYLALNIEIKNKFLLEVNEKNKKALKLYKKIGFEEISIRKNYYGKDENAVIMIKYY